MEWKSRAGKQRLNMILGIVVTDEKAAVSFYRDVLGLEWEGELPLPGGRMYRLKCGTTVIKLLKLDKTPAAKPAPGGPAGGLRLPLLHNLGARYSRTDSAARGQGHPPDGPGHRVPSGCHYRDGDRSRRQHSRVHPDCVTGQTQKEQWYKSSRGVFLSEAARVRGRKLKITLLTIGAMGDTQPFSLARRAAQTTGA